MERAVLWHFTFELTQNLFHGKTGTTTGPGFGAGFSPCSRRHDAATVAAVAAADAMRYPYWPEGKHWYNFEVNSVHPLNGPWWMFCGSVNCYEFSRGFVWEIRGLLQTDFFNFVDRFTHLSFTATGLPMKQHT